MKKKMGIFKKKYIPGILCIVVFFVTFVSAGLNLFAANSDRGIYYRNDLPGTYISAEEAYSYYEEQYGSGEAEENRLQYEMLFWNDHGEGQMESVELGRLSTGDIVYTCGRMLCGLITMILGCVFWENKLHGNCLERFRQKV